MADRTTYPVSSVRRGMTLLFGKLSMVDGTTVGQGTIAVATMDPGSYGVMKPYDQVSETGFSNMSTDGAIAVGTDDEWNDYLGCFGMMQENDTNNPHVQSRMIRPTLYMVQNMDLKKPKRWQSTFLLTTLQAQAQASYTDCALKSLCFMMLLDNTDRR